jgi:hypothetical protein
MAFCDGYLSPEIVVSLLLKVSGPAASAYKGHSWSREKEEYLSKQGLSNASYVINATELREDIFGPLVPCSFQVKC